MKPETKHQGGQHPLLKNILWENRKSQGAAEWTTYQMQWGAEFGSHSTPRNREVLSHGSTREIPKSKLELLTRRVEKENQ